LKVKRIKDVLICIPLITSALSNEYPDQPEILSLDDTRRCVERLKHAQSFDSASLSVSNKSVHNAISAADSVLEDVSQLDVLFSIEFRKESPDYNPESLISSLSEYLQSHECQKFNHMTTYSISCRRTGTEILKLNFTVRSVFIEFYLPAVNPIVSYKIAKQFAALVYEEGDQLTFSGSEYMDTFEDLFVRSSEVIHKALSVCHKHKVPWQCLLSLFA
jgi:hypothetical protein